MSVAHTALVSASIGAAAFGAVSWVSASPTSAIWGPVHYRGQGAFDGRYALTFDDGPTRDSTSAILDTLGELGVKATFFVVGRNARSCPDLLQRMDAEGHLIGNHSYDHDHLSMFRGNAYWNRQLSETNRVIEDAIGRRPLLFRPPMGVKTYFLMQAAHSQGHAVVTWSRRAMDGVATTAQKILSRVVPRTVSGDVLVLHDGVEPHSGRNPAPTVAALRPLILQLRARGHEPAPLDTLLQLSPYSTAGSRAAHVSP